MTPDLLTRLSAALEFDDNLSWQEEDDLDELDRACNRGQYLESERLRPIHKALIECVHQLRAYKCEDGPCQCGDCAALTALEAALREGEE